jgi:dTDP-4-amino-4,6-dideoxygalactose transaminase
MNFKVPFVNYPLQYHNLGKEIDEVIKGVLNRGDLILRSDVEEFEKNIASFLGTKYAVGVNSCTDAMILSLKAAGIKEGDEVITVSHTFFATIEAIVHCGAKPILIDVGEDFLMDMDKLKPAITSKTRAILPVHLNGRSCDMGRLMKIAKRHNLIVIEDTAQALGAKFEGKKAGSFSLAGCFSFYPAKILGALGDGGMVTTNNKNIAEKVRLLRNHGQKTKTRIVYYGFTSRLHNLQAAILNVKFKHLPEWIKKRREIAQFYNKGLSNVEEIKLPPAPRLDSRFFDVYQNYVLRAKKRDELYQFLKEKGVETLIKDPVPNHWQKDLGLSHFCLPFTEQLAKEIISIPMYPELSKKQVEHVISCISNFYTV